MDTPYYNPYYGSPQKVSPILGPPQGPNEVRQRWCSGETLPEQASGVDGSLMLHLDGELDLAAFIAMV